MHYRGAGRMNKGILLSTLNVTSLFKHWQVLLSTETGILVATETRATVEERAVIDRRL